MFDETQMFNDDSSAELKVNYDSSLSSQAIFGLHMISLNNILGTFQELWIALAVKSANFGENCKYVTKL